MSSKSKLREIVQGQGLGSTESNRRQQIIHDFMLVNSESIRRPNFRQLSAADVGLLFQVTDEQFFAGRLGQTCELDAAPPRFRLSTRMTSSGGMTTMQKTARNVKDFEIAIGTTPLFQTFQHNETCIVGGRICKSRLEALQRIMEHEMVHLAEMLLWNDSNCSGARFKGVVRGLFGHTESNHQLLTPRDVASRKYKIRIGDRVCFYRHGRELTGFVNRITKRATVLVDDDCGRLHTDGKRYLRFYVPFKLLKKAA